MMLFGTCASSNPWRWYIVHAYSGMEKAVENILERIGRAGMQDKFSHILVPTRKVVEMKNETKTTENATSVSGLCVRQRWSWMMTPGT